MQKPQTFIFIGRSGCGKGTQAELLIKKLSEIDPIRKSLYIQTGQELRELIKGESFTQKYAHDVYMKGGLQPEFLSVYAWSKVIVEKYSGDDHLIFDGTPRRLHEAGALHSLFTYFNIEKPWVINVDISEDESRKRLSKRQRMDDDPEDVKKRLAWYESDVAPALAYYDDNPSYNFLKIFGERSVEEIHADIVKKVGMS